MNNCKGCGELTFGDEGTFCCDECELIFDLRDADVPEDLVERVRQMLELE